MFFFKVKMSNLTLVDSYSRFGNNRCGHAIPHCVITNKYRRCSHYANETWGDRGPINADLTALTQSHPPTNSNLRNNTTPEELEVEFAQTPICAWHGSKNNPSYKRGWIKLIPYSYLVEMYGEVPMANVQPV